MADHEFEIEVGGVRLDRLVTDRLTHLSRARVIALIRGGMVSVNGAAAKPSTRPLAGAVITVDEPPPVEARLEPQDIPLTILHQDEDLAVVVKPAGMVSHPAPGHYDGTLVNALLHHLDDLSGVGGEARPGIVHRLDKGTSGVMVVAKRDEAHRALQVQFAAHTIERAYWALVLEGPRVLEGTLESELGRNPHERMRYASVERNGRRAVTHWRVAERLHRSTLIECRLETGRTHQIRVHMSEQGWPVMCDPMYRARRTPPPVISALLGGIDHQLLHARLLAFDHPRTGERVSFEYPPPEDFQSVLDGLRAIEA